MRGVAVIAVMLASPAWGADEHETVRRIHDRIAARHDAEKVDAYSVTIPNTSVSYPMVPIPGGPFRMGSEAKKDQQPKHLVHLDSFWMQAHEVTWDEYRLFMFEKGNDPNVDAVSHPTRPYVEMSFGMGIEGYPAISMTQHAASKYAEWLSAKTGEFYRLPTEAEWEYACRAGSAAEARGPLGDVAWFAGNSNGTYQKVATKKPNAWGLYDMLGNVMEWTLDAYAPYRADEVSNPRVAARAPYPHAVRGGSWADAANAVSCTARVASDASWKEQDPQLPKSVWYMTDAQWLGFRLVRPAKLPDAEAMYGYWNSGVEHDEGATPAPRKKAAELGLFQAVEPHMGTLFSIKLYARGQAEADRALRAAFDRIARLDRELSDYDPSSELSRATREGVGKPVKIGDDLFRVLDAAQRLSEESSGAFDITAGPVVRLWREARRTKQLPDPDELDAALSHVGYRKLHLDAAARTLTVDQDGMQLDAGGIAKGFAADEALALLRALGVKSALVAASGDIAAGDAPPGRAGWEVEAGAAGKTLTLANCAVSTSGDTEQYLEANGKRYSHIIDPITGIALTNRLEVSVVAPTGTLADGLATAVSVLGERRGRELGARHPRVTVFVRTLSDEAKASASR